MLVAERDHQPCSVPKGTEQGQERRRGTRCTTRPRSGGASPQGRVLRHVVGHLPLPALDVPVPQLVDQLPDIVQFFRALSRDPVQVIEVPKILPFDVPLRAALRVTQLVEQLVEVPTIFSYSSLQWTVEQHVDIPVPGGGGSSSGLQVFPLESVQQRRLPRNAFLSGLWSRSLTLFLVEVFTVLSQDMVHLLLTLQLVMKSAQMSLAKWFFALFTNIKKCEVGFALGVGTAPRVEPIHAGCSAGGGGGGLARFPDPAQDAGTAGPAS